MRYNAAERAIERVASDIARKVVSGHLKEATAVSRIEEEADKLGDLGVERMALYFHGLSHFEKAKTYAEIFPKPEHFV